MLIDGCINEESTAELIQANMSAISETYWYYASNQSNRVCFGYIVEHTEVSCEGYQHRWWVVSNRDCRDLFILSLRDGNIKREKQWDVCICLKREGACARGSSYPNSRSGPSDGPTDCKPKQGIIEENTIATDGNVSSQHIIKRMYSYVVTI
jgi:hypothetical protein